MILRKRCRSRARWNSTTPTSSNTRNAATRPPPKCRIKSRRTIREERNQRLLELVNGIAARKYDAFIGRQVQILVEGPSRKNAARYTGRTRCNRIVLFDGSARHQGRLMDVKITRTGSFTLYGDPAIVNL